MNMYFHGDPIPNGISNVYSGEEVIIGTWFGKPLYRKVVEAKTPSSSGVGNVITILPTNCIARHLHGFIFYRDSNAIIPLPFAYDYRGGLEITHYFGLSVTRNNEIICNNYGNAFLDKDLCLIVEYIKTTD